MDPKSPKIQFVTLEDASRLTKIFEQIEAKTLQTTQVLERLQATEAHEYALLAELDGQDIGLLCLRVLPALSGPDHHAEITELYIQPVHQENGLEQMLLAKAESLAARKGASQLILLTGPKNYAAQARYRGLGYREYALALRKHLVQKNNHQADK